MAQAKTTKPAEKKTAEVKKEEVKAPVAATEKKTETKTAAPKKEAAKKAAAKKAAAPKKEAAKKPAAKKPAAKKAAAKKPAAKKSAAKKPATKKATAPKEVLFGDVFAAVSKKIRGTAVDKKSDVAIEVTISGTASGRFYIKAENGKLAVEPYDYKGADIQAYASTETLMKYAEGKVALLAAIESGDIDVTGNVGKALALKNLK
ncbi:MAG: SCP2 sterol-binding domain-containing protein [Oscillospiraceae bacterium]|nr:SCP2 sterol-binding domain-containing protein [Oscillospiraceae bacterium]